MEADLGQVESIALWDTGLHVVNCKFRQIRHAYWILQKHYEKQGKLFSSEPKGDEVEKMEVTSHVLNHVIIWGGKKGVIYHLSSALKPELDERRSVRKDRKQAACVCVCVCVCVSCACFPLCLNDAALWLVERDDGWIPYICKVTWSKTQ